MRPVICPLIAGRRTGAEPTPHGWYAPISSPGGRFTDRVLAQVRCSSPLEVVRLALAPASTLAGFRAWILAECPSAPGRRPAPAPHPGKATKTARFLDLVTERHGPLAQLPLHRVAGISADLAPQLDLNTGAARTAPGGQFPINDTYWTEEDYRGALVQAGFAVAAVDYPHPRDPAAWSTDEATVPPFIVIKAINRIDRAHAVSDPRCRNSTVLPAGPRRSDIPDGTVTYQGMGGSEHPADPAICQGPCDRAVQPARALCSRAPAACLAIGLSGKSAAHVSRRLGGRGYRPASGKGSLCLWLCVTTRCWW